MSYHNKQKKHQTHNNKCNCKDHSNHYEELCHKHKPSELNPKNIITSIDTDNTNNISNISELINVAELLSFLEDRYALLLKQHEVLTEKYNKLVNFVGETIWENQISHQLVALPLVNYSYKENNKYIDDYVVDKIISKNVHKNSVGVGNSNSYGENEKVHQYIACYKLLEPIIDKPLANSYRNSNNNNNNNDKIHQKQKYNVKHVVIKSYRKDKISSVNTLNRVNTEISTLRLLQGHKNIINVEKLMQTRNCINIVMTRMNIDLVSFVVTVLG